MQALSTSSLWLCHFALGSLIVLLGGTCMVLSRRQPVDRIRAIRVTLGMCILVPVLVSFPNLPRIQLGSSGKTSELSGTRAPGRVERVEGPWIAAHADHSDVDVSGRVERISPQRLSAREADTAPIREDGARGAQSAVTPTGSTSGILSAARDVVNASWGKLVSLFSRFAYVIFLIPAAIFAIRWLRGVLRLRQIYRHSAAAPSWMHKELSEIAGKVSPGVDIRVTHRVAVPLTWGCVRPVIVVPGRMADVPRAELRYVLAHEWSHIERNDGAVMLLVSGLRMILYFQPLYWWLSRRMMLDQDYLADAKAASFARSVDKYAEFLLVLAKSRDKRLVLPALGLSDRRSQLMRRVSMLCESTIPLRQHSSRYWTAFVVVASVGLLVTGSSVTLVADETKEGPSTPAAADTVKPAGSGIDHESMLSADAKEKLKVVEKRIADLRSAGQGADADKISGQYTRILSWIRGRAPLPKSDQEVELHVVGVYEGRADTDQTASVRVTYTDKPIILVLCAYNPVWWSVEADPGVQIERIILGGYHYQAMEKKPAGIEVERHVNEDGDRDAFQAYSTRDDSYDDALRVLKKLTGKNPTTFIGSYRAGREPLVVGPENHRWQLQQLVELIEELYKTATAEKRDLAAAELGQITFPGVYLAPGSRSRRGTSVGMFTISGPLSQTLKPCRHELTQLAIDPKTGKAYGVTMHELFEVDLATGRTRELKLAYRKDLPRFGWTAGVAFDTKRRRLLVMTSHVYSRLYAHEVEVGHWSLLSTSRGHSFGGIAYHAKDDVLYMTGIDRSSGTCTSLHKFNAHGSALGEIHLSKPIAGEKTSLGRTQLIPLNDDLFVIMPAPGRHPRADDAGDRHQAFVVDRNNGEVVYSCMQTDPVEKETAGDAIDGDDQARRRRGQARPAPRIFALGSMDADAVARVALTMHDLDKDGAISGGELDGAPGLKAAVKNIDTDEDGSLTAQEIADRVRAWQESKVAFITVYCQVLIDERPAEGIAVVFEPEPFVKEFLSPARGVTKRYGDEVFASLTLPVTLPGDLKFHGAQPGLYVVRISKNVDGVETIPERYNSKSTLGAEVGIDVNVGSAPLVFDISSQ